MPGIKNNNFPILVRVCVAPQLAAWTGFRAKGCFQLGFGGIAQVNNVVRVNLAHIDQPVPDGVGVAPGVRDFRNILAVFAVADDHGDVIGPG